MTKILIATTLLSLVCLIVQQNYIAAAWAFTAALWMGIDVMRDWLDKQ